MYRARDTRLDRTVAIKILPPHLSSNPELTARFEREARAVSSLNHSNICQLYDVGTQDGIAFLVMEYLNGETLADKLRKGPLPLKVALDYAIQITEALATAHRAGILHRDLKPQNVMLTPGGAKLLDFGLAKAAPALGSGSSSGGMTPSTPTMTIAELTSPAQSLTRQGTVVGTFQYMAPEVLHGAEADIRSDIFSLGCVLYEMFAGRRAFDGKSQLGVMTAILEKEPESVSQIQPSTPAALDHLIKTCLEKNPEERFQTAQDAKLQLKWIASGSASSAKLEPASSARPSWWAWAVAAIAILCALGAAVAYVRVASRALPVTRSSILPPAGSSYVTSSPTSGPVVISPDGSHIAFTARDDKGKVLLYVRSLNSLSAQPVAGSEEANYPFWSADSRNIGFFSQSKLKRVPVDGAPVQVICDVSAARGGAWNKDGIILFTPSTSAPIMRVSAAGGTPEPATKLDVGRGENSHRWPHFLPDGKHFLFWGRTSQGMQDQAIFAGTLGTVDATLVMKGVSSFTYASGYLLYRRDQTLLAQPFDSDKLRVTGDPVPIAEHIAINAATESPEFSASDNGILVYHMGEAAGAWDLIWYSRDGKSMGPVAPSEHFTYPSLSPDGKRVAVSLFDGSSGEADLWVLDLQRGTKSRFTFDAGMHVSAVWSADGKTLYYGSSKDRLYHIYAKPADGSGSEQTILNTPDSIEVPTSASSDGKYLVFLRKGQADSKNTYGIWALPLSGDRKPFPVIDTPFSKMNPSVSPTGKWLAYQSNESGRSEIYVTAFPGGGARWQASTAGGADVQWRGDGKELFFLDPSDNVVAVDIDGSGAAPILGSPHILFQAVGVQRQIGSFVAAKDGKKFLVNTSSAKQSDEAISIVTNWTAELNKQP